MDVAVFPADPSPALVAALALASVRTVTVEDLAAAEGEAAGDWAAIVVELGDEASYRLRALRRLQEETGIPALVVASRQHSLELEQAPLLGDFMFSPPDPVELRLRLGRLWRAEDEDEVLHFKDLQLNTATYQATVGTRPVDLTYMEYELLRYFVEHRGRVWSREQLLSKVWGYDYFGGARTVDVHVRRLRAKLGEERASWITTVRSVGYRFG